MLFLLSYTGGGNVSWCSNRGEQYDVPQKIKNRMTIRSSSRTPGHLFRRNCSSKRCVLHYVHSSTFTTAKSWRQRKCPSTWMDTDDGGRVHGGTLLSLRGGGNNATCSNTAEMIILNKVRQKERDERHVLSFICGLTTPWRRRQRYPAAEILPGKPHRQRSLAG